MWKVDTIVGFHTELGSVHLAMLWQRAHPAFWGALPHPRFGRGVRLRRWYDPRHNSSRALPDRVPILCKAVLFDTTFLDVVCRLSQRHSRKVVLRDGP